MRIFIDFDNTITRFDVLYELIKRFSINSEWIELEKAWQMGKITTKECLLGQMRNIRIYRNELFEYLKYIKIDPNCI